MSDADTRPFWLGVIGGLLGIAAAFFAFFISFLGTGLAGAGTGAGEEFGTILLLGVAALIFSVSGIVGGSLRSNRAGGWAMVLSGIFVLISVSLFGVPTFLLFLIGGILRLTSHS
ncbi:hypothetical protein RJ53_09385 [Methanocalculus chunghsingensis]|uniref:DUF4064 domain-containing protein n=1 Tax=Methanocalculus chunghsingensis TaxID=156457 RepID=A0A8J7WAL0_9EURY|nr:hypothetical protein [Methanocalculus chunghsingensis]MBR1369675.1 hypothetical protein [Methanocalculus chunghsingensis]